MDTDESTIFLLKFGSSNFVESNYQMTAYSYDRDVIWLFAKQHGFDLNLLKVDIIDNMEIYTNNCDNDEFDEDLDLLRIYRFKSNKHPDELFTLYSTQRLIDDTIITASDALAEYLQFGKIFDRDDVGFIDTLKTIINYLPHALAMSSGGYDYKLYDTDADSLDYIYQTFEEQMSTSYTTNGYVMNVTIEAYISSFVDMMLDQK